MEYYLAIKKCGVLIHAPTWMNPENIKLSENSLSQETMYCRVLYERPRIGKSTVRKSICGCPGLRVVWGVEIGNNC